MNLQEKDNLIEIWAETDQEIYRIGGAKRQYLVRSSTQPRVNKMLGGHEMVRSPSMRNVTDE